MLGRDTRGIYIREIREIRVGCDNISLHMSGIIKNKNKIFEINKHLCMQWW